MSQSTSIRMPDELRKKIDQIAEFHDRKPNWLMVKALEHFADQEIKEIEFLHERSRLAEEDRLNSRLVPAKDAIESLRARVIK